MTFTALQETFLKNAREQARVGQLCDRYQQAAIATDEASLIAAGLPIAVWLYQSGVVNDTLLTEFTESELNAAGVYTDGAFTLTSPSGSIYILSGADVTVDLNSADNCTLHIMGTGTVDITAADNALLNIKLYNQATVTADLSGAATACAEARKGSSGIYNLTDDATLHIGNRGGSASAINGAGSSFTKVRSYAHASVLYTLSDSATIDFKSYGGSAIFDNSSSL